MHAHTINALSFLVYSVFWRAQWRVHQVAMNSSHPCPCDDAGVLSEILYRRRLLAPDVSSSICAGICFGLSACSARCGMLIAATHGAAGMMGGVVLSIVLTSCGFVAQVRFGRL